MIYYDVHTHHHRKSPDVVSIESFSIGDLPLPLDRFISVGLHPWYIENEAYSQLSALKTAASASNVVAIGEAGFDRLVNAPMEMQKKVFEEQAILAEELKKPLIIHCVKGWSELLEARKIIKPSQPWIIHGFRGNKELALQLRSKGILLSFGRYYNDEALKATFDNSPLLMETDESETTIQEVYSKIASTLELSVDMIGEKAQESFAKIFGEIRL